MSDDLEKSVDKALESQARLEAQVLNLHAAQLETAD